MLTHRFRSTLATAAVATTLSCGDERMILEPGLGKGGASAPLRVIPGTLPFVIPPEVPATITATVQYVGQIMARTSDPACATVAPSSMPATKPPGSSVYVATFTVTPVAEGSCTITLTDKKGQQAEVDVSVATAGRIVFISTREGNSEIYTIRPDGTNLTRLTTTTEHESDPAFSPDGRQIAFTVYDGTTNRIYVMDADGENRTLVPGTDNGGTPAFSRDGQRLVFELYYEDTGNTELASIDLDGTGLQRLTTAPGLNDFSLSPTVSPGGRIVTYAQRVSDLPPGLFILDSDGSNWARLTGETQRAHLPGTPDFAPDGSRIVFQCDPVHHNEDICVINPDGSGVVRLTTGDAAEIHPAYSPAGDRIAFQVTELGSSETEIYIMAADGSGPVNLTSHPGFDGQPDWQ